MNKIKFYCVTNKLINFISNENYNLAWVGKDNPPTNYIQCNHEDNIFYKEKNYSELTFQYLYWKNMLDLDNSNWIGFCQKRRFWVKKNSNIEANSTLNFINQHLSEPYPEWESFDAIICKSINVNKVKKMKLIKRGFRSIIKDPTIFFNEILKSLYTK